MWYIRIPYAVTSSGMFAQSASIVNPGIIIPVVALHQNRIVPPVLIPV